MIHDKIAVEAMASDPRGRQNDRRGARLDGRIQEADQTSPQLSPERRSVRDQDSSRDAADGSVDCRKHDRRKSIGRQRFGRVISKRDQNSRSRISRPLRDDLATVENQVPMLDVDQTR
jgi:hypothetical protein